MYCYDASKRDAYQIEIRNNEKAKCQATTTQTTVNRVDRTTETDYLIINRHGFEVRSHGVVSRES